LVAAVLCSLGTAQDPATRPVSSQPQEEAQSFAALEAEFDQVWREWRSKGTGLDGEEKAAHAAADPTARYVAVYRAGAERHRGTAAAVDYLMWMVGRAWPHDSEATLAALDRLTQDHLGDARMTRLAFSLALKARRSDFPRQRVLDAQDLIAANTADDEAKAEVLYWRSYVIAGTESDADQRQRACSDLAMAAELGNQRIRQRAEGLLFEMNRLQVGMAAPDIEAEDLDGTAFRLSDYRGKVVFLDFWGDW